MEANKLTIGVIGAGTMGAGIAQVAATAGHNVVLFDQSADMLDRAKTNYEKVFKVLVEKGKISADTASATQQRISYASNLKAFANCGLIIEAIVENLQVKETLFKQLEEVVSQHCILASNTSSLSITLIASACEHPERFMGIHFFNPAPLMPLVEIVAGVQTNEHTFKTGKQIIDSWGKTTVVAKDTPGFIVNRVARPYYGEAIRIYEEGIADLSTIDWAMKHFGGFRMGPFELMDFIGNDINYKVTESVWEQMFYDARYKPSFTQKRLYEAKRFGRKSGRGYYNYGDNAVIPEPITNEVLGKEIFMRVLVMLINEAAEALHLSIASRDDLDTALTKGVNYPKGLLQWADEIGINEVLTRLDALYDDYREDRYRASVLLRRMAKNAKRFY